MDISHVTQLWAVRDVGGSKGPSTFFFSFACNDWLRRGRCAWRRSGSRCSGAIHHLADSVFCTSTHKVKQTPPQPPLLTAACYAFIQEVLGDFAKTSFCCRETHLCFVFVCFFVFLKGFPGDIGMPGPNGPPGPKVLPPSKRTSNHTCVIHPINQLNPCLSLHFRVCKVPEDHQAHQGHKEHRWDTLQPIYLFQHKYSSAFILLDGNEYTWLLLLAVSSNVEPWMEQVGGGAESLNSLFRLAERNTLLWKDFTSQTRRVLTKPTLFIVESRHQDRFGKSANGHSRCPQSALLSWYI